MRNVHGVGTTAGKEPPMSITTDPENLAYHIVRSVPHDEVTVIGDVLVMKRGNEIMTCECPPNDDVRVSVCEIGAGAGWRVTWTNDTDTITRMWAR
jgi:hypothetical protein